MARKKLWIDNSTKNKNLSGKTGVGLETTRQLIKHMQKI